MLNTLHTVITDGQKKKKKKVCERLENLGDKDEPCIDALDHLSISLDIIDEHFIIYKRDASTDGKRSKT